MSMITESIALLGLKPNERFKIKGDNQEYLFDIKGNLARCDKNTKVWLDDKNLLMFLKGELVVENTASNIKDIQEKKYLGRTIELFEECNTLMTSTLEEIERRLGVANYSKIESLIHGLMKQSAIRGEVRHRLEMSEIYRIEHDRIK